MGATVTVDTITTGNWQLSNAEYGQVAVDADDICMSIQNILFIRRGEVPGNPYAGSNILQWVDKPLSVAIPGIKAEVIDAITQQEPRVIITTVTIAFDGDTGATQFAINMKVVGTANTATYNLNLSGLSPTGNRSFTSDWTTDFS